MIKKTKAIMSVTLIIIGFIPTYIKAETNNIPQNNTQIEINDTSKKEKNIETDYFLEEENIEINDSLEEENIDTNDSLEEEDIDINDSLQEENTDIDDIKDIIELNNLLEEDTKIQDINLEEFIKELITIFHEEEVSQDQDYMTLGEDKGYLKGIENRNKNEFLTKAMASRIVCNALEINPIYSKYDLFEDIKDVPDKGYIKAAYGNHLIDSEDENKFDPNKNITKEELKNIIERIKNFKANTNTPKEENEKIKKLFSMTEYKPPLKKIDYGLEIGTLEEGNASAYINGYFIPSFTYNDSTMIALSDLKYYGFDIIFNDENKVISLYRNENKDIIGISDEDVKLREDTLVGKPMIYTNIDVYIGNRKIPSYNVNNMTIIYINDLIAFSNVHWDGDKKEISVNLKEPYYKDDLNIKIIGNKILNNNDITADIEVVNLWYDTKSKEFNIEEDFFYGIPKYGYETFDLKKYDLYEKNLYIGTIIKSINSKENPLFEDELNYLKSDKIIEYTLSIYKDPEEEILSLVKPSIIIGTMKRSVGGFEKGEKVEILYAEAGYWYKCKSMDGKKEGKIPWGSVLIPKDPPTNKNQMTKEQLEFYVNKKEFKSNTNYLVWTDLERQITHVFKKDKDNWKLVRSMLCSTGRNITPTPRGFFTIKERGAYFGDGYMCKNWVQIWGDYLYHSVIMDVTGSYILENNVLGKRASQGCIRFSLENSKWFYDTIPRNTTVWIN